MAVAWAVKVDGALNLRTVMDSARGAKVNGMLVLFNVQPRPWWTDDDIARLWDECLARLAVEKPHHRVEVVPVEVFGPGERDPAVERLRAALSEVKVDLTDGRGLNRLSIVDTIWHSEIETAVDFIDNTLEATR